MPFGYHTFIIIFVKVKIDIDSNFSLMIIKKNWCWKPQNEYIFYGIDTKKLLKNEKLRNKNENCGLLQQSRSIKIQVDITKIKDWKCIEWKKNKHFLNFFKESLIMKNDEQDLLWFSTTNISWITLLLNLVMNCIYQCLQLKSLNTHTHKWRNNEQNMKVNKEVL